MIRSAFILDTLSTIALWFIMIFLMLDKYGVPGASAEQVVIEVTENHFDIEDAILNENQDLKLEINYMQNANLELIKACNEK